MPVPSQSDCWHLWTFSGHLKQMPNWHMPNGHGWVVPKLALFVFMLDQANQIAGIGGGHGHWHPHQLLRLPTIMGMGMGTGIPKSS